MKALIILLSAELVFAIFIGQTAFLHRRDFDRAFFTWYKNQTPTHRLEVERQRGINELHRWNMSAVAFATMAAPTLLGFYAIRRRRKKTADDQDRNEKIWRDALGSSPARDFTSRVFACKPAMVKKTLVNGHRMWTEYDPSKFSAEEYEIVPGMWDHEHCAICSAKIREGDSYWQNSEWHILCPRCHDTFEKREPTAP